MNLQLGSGIAFMRNIQKRPFGNYSQRAVITKAVLEKLIRNDISPGESISEEELAQQFGVSRTPIREALILLERQQMTINETNRGFFAAPVSFEGLRSYFDMAKCVFPFLFVRAAKNGSETLSREAIGTDQSGIPAEAGDSVMAHFKLISSIANAADNPFSAETAMAGESYHCMMRRSILNTRPPEVVLEANRELWEQDCAVIQALSSKDEAQITQSVDDLIASSRRFIVSNMI